MSLNLWKKSMRNDILSDVTRRLFISKKLQHGWHYESLNESTVYHFHVNPLSANPTKWSNTLKEFARNLSIIQ